MKVRRDRVQSQGRSNFDFRAESQNDYNRNTRIQLLATCKPNNFNELVHNKIMKIAPNPIQTTKDFYKEKERDIRINNQ